MGCWDETSFKCSGSHDAKRLLFSNLETDDFDTWYTASGTQVLPNLFK